MYSKSSRGLGSKRSNADSSNKLTIQSRVERKTQEKETFAFVPSFYGRQCRLITVYYLSKIQLLLLQSYHTLWVLVWSRIQLHPLIPRCFAPRSLKVDEFFRLKIHCVRSLKTGRRFSQPRSRGARDTKTTGLIYTFPPTFVLLFRI